MRAARYAWDTNTKEYAEDQLVLLKIKGKIIGRTLVQDYVFQPVEYSQVSLYDWIRLSVIEKCPKGKEENSSPHDIVTTELIAESDADYDDGNNNVNFYHF